MKIIQKTKRFFEWLYFSKPERQYFEAGAYHKRKIEKIVGVKLGWITFYVGIYPGIQEHAAWHETTTIYFPWCPSRYHV